VAEVDYKNVNQLRRYISEKGKIRNRRITGACRRHQRQVAVAVNNTALAHAGSQGGARTQQETSLGMMDMFDQTRRQAEPGVEQNTAVVLKALPPVVQMSSRVQEHPVGATIE
jgi:hypothetical protein